MFPGFIFDSSSLLLSLPHFSCASCACLLVHHFFRPSYCCGQAELEESGDVTKGVRTSELQRGLKRLASDPWLALGLQPPPEPLGSSLQQQQPTEAELNRLKKAWRRLALKYHPDKTQNRTSALFATIQVRALVWPLRLSSPPSPRPFCSFRFTTPSIFCAMPLPLCSFSHTSACSFSFVHSPCT